MDDNNASFPWTAVAICISTCFMCGCIGARCCRRSRSVPRKLRARIFCLAYPCSLDGGVDAVKYAEQIFERYSKTGRDARGGWENVLYQFLGQDRMDLPADWLNKELFIRRGEELRGKWGRVTAQDRTNMKDDYVETKLLREDELVKLVLPDKMAVIEEAGDERVPNLKCFLRTPDSTGAKVDVLYLMGHGLSEESARMLRESPACDECKKSKTWKWPLYDCEDPNGIGKNPSEVTGNAKKGDIVVFCSGLLTPEWIVEQLRAREEDTTVVIVVDSCYSGTWTDRMECVLDSNPLERTRVIVQTACASDEVSYGKSFTPRFVALQEGTVLEDLHGQTPTFFDSRPDGYDSQNGLVNTCGLVFFSRLKSERRGIPKAEFEPFFASFSSNSPPAILGSRLKTHKYGTPQAFFLMRWKSEVYNLHLHFRSFKDTVEGLELTGISHVDAMPSLGTGRYKEVGHKETIVKYKHRNAHTEEWQHFVKPPEASIKKLCMDFVTAKGINWKEEQTWKMQNSVPPLMISVRSRSATFKETDPHSRPGDTCHSCGL